MPKNCVIVIDALGTTRFLPEELTKLGVLCIHVLSPGEKSAYLLSGFADIKKYFYREFDGAYGLDRVVEKISALDVNVIGVVGGTDSAPKMMDQLAARLGLSQNNPNMSDARRCKARMGETLASKNLAHIQHLKSINPDEIIAWANANNHWPIVVKPTDGAGTEGLSICYKPLDVFDAIQNLSSMKSFLGHSYSTALAQPYIDGNEYIVNTVSSNGQHYVSDIWTSVKEKGENGKTIIYDRLELLPSRGRVEDRLVDYMRNVLDAFEIKKGPTHSELFLTNKGPILIEVNMRIMGLAIPHVMQQEALPSTQISLTAEVFADVNKFLESTAQPYQLKQHMACVIHQVREDNCVVNEAAIELFKQLPSFKMHKFSAKGEVAKTRDLINTVGWVLLAHKDNAVLQADIKKVREIEKQLFQPQPRVEHRIKSKM